MVAEINCTCPVFSRVIATISAGMLECAMYQYVVMTTCSLLVSLAGFSTFSPAVSRLRRRSLLVSGDELILKRQNNDLAGC